MEKKMNISDIFINGKRIETCTELSSCHIDIIDDNFVCEEVSDVSNFEWEIECTVSEEDSEKLYLFFYDIAIRTWKRFLAWITFCVEYFRRN